MGQEITRSHFKKSDFERYRNKLDAELLWVKKHFSSINSDTQLPLSIGFEMEICLLDQAGEPAQRNALFLQRIQETAIASQISLELAQFNIELNSLVLQLQGSVLRELEQELKYLWDICSQVARDINCSLLMVGILPSLREEHLNLKNMSPMTRYKALNEQVLRSRKGRAIELDIQGSETLKSIHQDVMLESAATSFQLHLQIPLSRSVRFYNAAIILSAPIVAVSANSPFLFAKDLWCETRIPVFEQAVSVGGFDGAMFGPIKRVSFGSGYARDSLLECFEENNEHYPVLLPEVFASDVEDLAHLTLHNGTVWRWNRPLVAFTDKHCTTTGKQHRDYHLRLEHRVIPAGPSIVDSIANAALFYGAITALAHEYTIPEQQLSFVQAKENFYLCAKQGLKAKINWLEGKELPLKNLLLDSVLPLARNGLTQLGIDRADIDYYLGIIEQRTRSGQTGASWQRQYVEKYGKNMLALTRAYQKNQQSGRAVHEWQL